MNIIIAMIATARLTLMLMYESGPYDIFERMRQVVGIKEGYIENRTGIKLQIQRILLCYYCTSIYMAVITYLAMLYFAPFNYILVFSAVTIFLIALHERFVIGGGQQQQ